VTLTHQKIFERYLYAGAITRNPDAIAELFSDDGIYEAPLVPVGHRLPCRLAGREAIRAGIGAYHREPAPDGTVNFEASRYALHDTTDPDMFLAEIDAAFDHPTGEQTTISLVQIFRIRDGQIALLRDYFAAPPATATARPDSQ
jgi:ketosteroid isomerase-like protein